jgi:hypothetical protein
MYESFGFRMILISDIETSSIVYRMAKFTGYWDIGKCMRVWLRDESDIRY